MPPHPGHCIAYMDVEFSGWWPSDNPAARDRVAANACLIAAAPKLLAALVRLADYGHDPDCVSLEDYNRALADARAAIAAATGEAS